MTLHKAAYLAMMRAAIPLKIRSDLAGGKDMISQLAG